MTSSSRFNSREFKKLQEIWYKKLTDSGFIDIEDKEERLKSYASTDLTANFNPTTFEAKAEYYRLAGQFLHDHIFKNHVEKQIWEWHSQAISIGGENGIHARLKSKGVGKGRDQIKAIILNLSKIMVAKCNVQI